MALTDDSGTNMVMPVTPMGNTGNGGFGDCFGGNGFWILLLFLLLGGNGWGNGFGGGFGGNDIYPWMNQSNQINGGFRDQMLNTSINGIQNGITSGFGDVQTALCGGFAGVNAGIAAAQNGITQQMYANQIADLERSFAAQTANTQGMNALQSQLASCCCDNRLATANLQNVVQSENCADRTAAYQNTRDIIDSQTRGTQAILDKLCQLELDGVKQQVDAKNDRILELQNQLNQAAFRESQANQNALFAQGMNNEVDALYNRLSNCPVPTTPVYGRTPIFTCNNGGCGCGNNGF
jgi:hypothetical protein